MSEMNVPEFFDRATAEYCAEVCDHVAAVLLVRVGKHREAVAAGACARAIRAAITLARPLPPATLDTLVSCETDAAVVDGGEPPGVTGAGGQWEGDHAR